MKTFVTSDLHFGHKNIMNFEPVNRARFQRIEDMDGIMIKEWNDVVQAEDDVYILGDVAFRSPADSAAILRQLNGFLHLIPGNHDRKNLEHEIFRQCFYAIHSDIYELDYQMPENPLFKGTGRERIVMCHYPIAEWNGCHRGAVHFYGHLHSNKIGGEFDQLRTLNVGMDATGRIVMPIEEAIATAKKGKIKGHHE